jgi:molecular chaperone DnaK
VRLEVTRDKFVELTRDLLDRTAFTARQTLQAAGLEWKDIDHVLMVGGATRMPMVIDQLAELTGKAPDASVSADEAVAHGAALRAGLLIAKRDGKDEPFKIRNVNSHSLGVAATDPQTRRKRNAILIPRNTPLPVAAKRVFKTQKQGQKSVLVQIVEGESASPDDCSQIGKCTIRDLPSDLPPGTSIEVRFRYEENGRLQVQVSVGDSGKELKHEIARENTLTVEQLDSWRQYITGISVGDAAANDAAAGDSGTQRWS